MPKPMLESFTRCLQTRGTGAFQSQTFDQQEIEVQKRLDVLTRAFRAGDMTQEVCIRGLFNEEQLSPAQYQKAVEMLQVGTPDRLLKAFLAGEISLEVFKATF